MPVVTPSRASMLTVKAVPSGVSLCSVMGRSPSWSARSSVRQRQTSPRAWVAMKLIATPDAINFMATHARGLVCLCLTEERADQLGLRPITEHNETPLGTAFTVSIEAREGVTTGISAADRSHTIQVVIHPDSTGHDLVQPGHVFPLRAKPGGVLERIGQTEAAVDLARLAGLTPAGV